MCELDCSQCVAGTCVCPAGYGGFGEGTNVNGCALNLHTVVVLWEVVLAVSVLGVVVSAVLLARWLYGGGIDWRKLYANRNFRLVFNVFCIDFLFGLLAVLRIQNLSLIFNDAGATIVYFLVIALLFHQCNLLTDLCHDTLVGLLAALGVKEGIAPRTPWQKRAFFLTFTTPFVPVLAAPALDFAGRRILVMLSLVAFALNGPLLLSVVCFTGEKVIKLLKSIGTEATFVPRRRIRMLLLNFYCTGASSMTFHILILCYVENFPYFLPSFCLVYAFALIPPILGLSYDRAKITRPLPSTSGKTPREPSSPSTTGQATAEMAKVTAIELGSIEPQIAPAVESA